MRELTSGLSVLTDLQNREIKDTLIASIDNLVGFADAIESVFPETTVQLCIVHQIHNSCKYVGSKHQKEFLKDFKLVYKAVYKETTEDKFDDLELKWGEQYPTVIKSWRDNWEHLTAYFAYTEGIRRIIYTTNTVEGVTTVSYAKSQRTKVSSRMIQPWKNLSIWLIVTSRKSGQCPFLIGGQQLNN